MAEESVYSMGWNAGKRRGLKLVAEYDPAKHCNCVGTERCEVCAAVAKFSRRVFAAKIVIEADGKWYLASTI